MNAFTPKTDGTKQQPQSFLSQDIRSPVRMFDAVGEHHVGLRIVGAQRQYRLLGSGPINRFH